MTVVLDTSVLAAYVNTRDSYHDRACAIMRRVLRRELGAAVTCDLVLAEGMNLLWKRPSRPEVSDTYASLFLPAQGRPAAVELRPLDGSQLERARDLHLKLFERRGFSFTDSVLLVMALDLRASVASFDAGFDGLVTRISG